MLEGFPRTRRRLQWASARRSEEKSLRVHNLLVFPALGKQSPSRVSRQRNFVLRGTDRRTNAGENLFRVQRKDFESRSKAARLADESLIRGTVQSISDEVEALWEQLQLGDWSSP
jgi:hypothetical protein